MGVLKIMKMALASCPNVWACYLGLGHYSVSVGRNRISY
jgi:hypothetical protein